MQELFGLDDILKCYNGKRVLLTGDTGFKGSWLSLWLSKLGALVAGFALPPYTLKDNYSITKVENLITHYEGDVRSNNELEKVFLDFKPEIIFHLAAQTKVLDGYNDPKYTFDVNVGGTVNVLECSKKFDFVNTIIVITSDKCYENKEWIWPYRENDSLGGYDPYSASKAAVELVCSSYRNSFFNPIEYKKHGKSLSTARAGNVIGGGDWAANQLIPDCIRALESGNNIKIRNPEHTRPWQFVLEPLWGYLLLAAKMNFYPTEYCGVWNFGPKISSIVPVSKIADLVIKNYNKGEWEYFNSGDNKHETQMLAIDYSKAYFKLGWQPTLELEEAIKLTIDWYINYLNKQTDMLEFCNNQIDLFSDSIKLKII